MVIGEKNSWHHLFIRIFNGNENISMHAFKHLSHVDSVRVIFFYALRYNWRLACAYTRNDFAGVHASVGWVIKRNAFGLRAHALFAPRIIATLITSHEDLMSSPCSSYNPKCACVCTVARHSALRRDALQIFLNREPQGE